MQINKFQFPEFKKVSSSEAEDILNTELQDNDEHNSNDNESIEHSLEEFNIDEQDDINVDSAVLLEEPVNQNIPDKLQEKILEQNEHIQATLIELRNLLVTIEKQQESNIVETSKKFISFIAAVTNKIFKDMRFKDIVQSVLINRVNDVVSRFSELSKLSIIIPKISEDFKKDLIDSIKNTANKLNIEVTEHDEPSNKVNVKWEDGGIEIDIDQTIDQIEEAAHKIDTTT